MTRLNLGAGAIATGAGMEYGLPTGLVVGGIALCVQSIARGWLMAANKPKQLKNELAGEDD